MAFWKKLTQREELAKLLKFGVTGLLNTGVDYLAFALLNGFFGWSAATAQVLSYGAGMLNSFLLNRSWTFRAQSKAVGAQAVRFVIANLGVLAVSVALIQFLTEQMALQALLAKLLVTAVTMILNFIVSRLWVFR